MTINIQEVVGPFPEWLAAKPKVTPLSGVENFETLRNDAVNWTATELLEGERMTVFMDGSNTMRVCSGTSEIADGDNLLWNAVRKAGFEDHLHPFFTIHSMIVDETAYIYDVIDGALPVPRGLWPNVNTFRIPEYNLTLPETAEEAVEQVQGLRSVLNSTKPIRGIVWWGEGLYLDPRCFSILNEAGIDDDRTRHTFDR